MNQKERQSSGPVSKVILGSWRSGPVVVKTGSIASTTVILLGKYFYSLFSSVGWGLCYVPQANLKFMIFLLKPPAC